MQAGGMIRKHEDLIIALGAEHDSGTVENS